LKNQAVAAVGFAEAPLLTGEGDVQGGDGGACAIEEGDAEERNECPAAQAAEGALRGAGRAVAVNVAAVVAAAIDRIEIVVPCAPAVFADCPAGRQVGVGGRAGAVGQRVEILLVGAAQCFQADSLGLRRSGQGDAGGEQQAGCSGYLAH